MSGALDFDFLGLRISIFWGFGFRFSGNLGVKYPGVRVPFFLAVSVSSVWARWVAGFWAGWADRGDRNKWDREEEQHLRLTLG